MRHTPTTAPAIAPPFSAGGEVRLEGGEPSAVSAHKRAEELAAQLDEPIDFGARHNDA